jgi:hypothetical protein
MMSVQTDEVGSPPVSDLVRFSEHLAIGSTSATRQLWALRRSTVACQPRECEQRGYNADRQVLLLSIALWASYQSVGRPMSQPIIVFRSFSPNRARPCAGRFRVPVSVRDITRLNRLRI